MNKKSPLDQYEDNWTTSLGAFFPGERVVIRGKDLFESYKNKSWMQLLLYTITGREFSNKQAKLFERIWSISTSYSDPRIWNNRVSALAGTVRSTASLAIGASTAISEASIYGRRPDIRASNFLTFVKEKLDSGSDLEEITLNYLKKFRDIPGYARPLVNSDERIEPLMEALEVLEIDKGLYLDLAIQIEQILLKSRLRMKANVAIITAALALDQGLSPREYYHYAIVSFTIGFLGCFVDSSEKREGALFPLPCERISYEGVNDQKW